MAIEIERKFLLRNDSWKKTADRGVRFSQGYLTEKGPGSVRVRIEGDNANLNIKSSTLDMQRLEYEYAIPLSEAQEMLDKLCLKPLINKTRYKVEHENHIWEVDVFDGDNAGLLVAEIELQDKNEKFALPEWAGEEVTEDSRYYNVSLVTHPFKDW